MQNCAAGSEEHFFIFIDHEPAIYIHHTGSKAWEHHSGGQTDATLQQVQGFF